MLASTNAVVLAVVEAIVGNVGKAMRLVELLVAKDRSIGVVGGANVVANVEVFVC